MASKTLGKLASDYASGAINKETYRKQRGGLLRAIVAGQTVVADINYLPPLELGNGTTTTTKPRARVRATPAPPSAPLKDLPNDNCPATPAAPAMKKLPAIHAAIGAAIIISLIIIAIVLFYMKPPELQKHGVIEKPGASPVTHTISSKVGEDLISKFLKENIWTDDSLNQFSQSWHALSTEERSAARGTMQMRRLKRSIYERFLKEHAMAGTDIGKALGRQQRLIDFAKSTGIKDPRMVID